VIDSLGKAVRRLLLLAVIAVAPTPEQIQDAEQTRAAQPGAAHRVAAATTP